MVYVTGNLLKSQLTPATIYYDVIRFVYVLTASVYKYEMQLVSVYVCIWTHIK